MRTLLCILITFSFIYVKAQFSLDFECQKFALLPIKLTDTEIKYFDSSEEELYNQNQFSLYNLDGTLYKTIVLPPKPVPASGLQVRYITRSLFDNDPSNIEYIVQYWYDSVPNMQYVRTKVIREDGIILLDELNGSNLYIFITEEGTKLRLVYQYATGYYYNVKFYSLPGILPTAVDEGKGDSEQLFSLYPNPNSGSFYIQFHSNRGKENTLQLYSSTGKLIDTYISKRDMFHITNYGLNDGLYLLKSQSEDKNTMTKMVIKK